LVIELEKVKVPAPVVVAVRPVVPVVLTAPTKVADVADPVTLMLAAVTEELARKVPAPATVRLPIAIVAEEPTAPERVIAFAPLMARALPATAASTLPVMVMVPTPEALRAAEELVDDTSPVRRRLVFDPAVTELAREIVLPAVAALIDTAPVD
jgi:hypothetical protein